MRLRALLFVLTASAAVGAGALRLGEAAALHVERTTAARAAEGLRAAGEDWARVAADGLIVTLSGVAPDEARRFRAAEILRQMLDPRRVRDSTAVAAADPLAPPPFALEILRNEAEVSLIGLAPEAAGGARIAAALAAGGLDAALADMLETVAHPPPPGWEAALGFGLDALGGLPRAKVSIAPGAVAIAASAASDAERAALEAGLRARAPDGVALDLAITAPRPVVSPFRVDYALDADGGALLACAAETEADAAAIAAAAGLDAPGCEIGLGAPSPDWAEAAAAGVAAVRALGAGRFAIVEIEATLALPPDAAPAAAAAAAAGLEAALPAVFSLAVSAPQDAVAAGAAASDAPPRFAATLAAGGLVRLEGPVQDATSRDAIGGFAAALFGHDRVHNATVLAPDLPEGWPGRVLAGIEALAMMKEGNLAVTEGAVALDGWTAEADGEAKAAELFAARALGPAELDVRFDAAAAAAEAAARAAVEDPAGACAAAVAAAAARAPVGFRPGAAELEDAAGPALAALAAVLADCPPVDFEIAGHTDSQGEPARNQALSEERAAAVKAALDAADLPHVRFVARGYGAGAPLADNATEEGRARNRRIEFTLVVETQPLADAARVADDPGLADGPR